MLFNPALGWWDFHPHRKLSYHLVDFIPLPEAICPPISDRFKMNESHYIQSEYIQTSALTLIVEPKLGKICT